MTTLSAGNSQTQTLPAYDTLTLITSSEGVGSVVRLGDTPGQEVQGITAVAAGSPVIIGPYAALTRYNIICRAGSISYEIARADFATEGEIGQIPWDDIQDKPDFGTAAEADTDDFATAAQGALAESSVQVGGQAPASALVLGTTNEQGVTVLVNGNEMLVIDPIGNVGIGVSDPEAPLAVAGAITVEAGAVATKFDPTSGADLSVGTVSSHPVHIITGGTTGLSVQDGLSVFATPFMGGGYMGITGGSEFPTIPTNSGVWAVSGDGTSQLILSDATLTAGNQRAVFQWSASAASLGFLNETDGTVVSAITFNGGAASGIASLTLNSADGQISAAAGYTPDADQSIATKKYADDLDTANVKLTGDQTIAGVKTFSSVPVLPSADASTDDEAVRKALLDARLSAAQRTAIDALVSPVTDYADLAAATAAIKSVIDALKAT
ncbi:hypothetical protein C5748_18370 [Phyllobacterium phragmitis]|uniref:Uncharacterized protein n=1 Tax=Phyllobacterium phragmitis TaxID=2670329 RepID=A0A2S9INM0_9HYPH|nr:hypothetical protein [Phyllobacterium phragmitis]PRD42115.1 hypothetical protein C5748_18370 [Phyllobacterium phragmitis]